MNITIILLYLLSFLLIYQFVGYPTIMAMVVSKLRNRDYSYQPFVSIIVPTYNEEKVIEKRMENLLDLDYPENNYEIIVVDSGSIDKTKEILKKFIEKNNHFNIGLKLVEENERKGKASAINFGKEYANGDIVLITDANSIFNKNVLKEMMPHFKDPNVGAVGGRYCVSNPETALGASESFYWYLEFIMREGEAHLDSACTFHGEINAWRKDLVRADTKMLTEDLDMAVQIKRAGYKVDYEANALVYEPAATTALEQITQRKRTSIGTIQCFFKHLRYFLTPKDLYSLLIFPSHKGLAIFSPFILVAIPILYIVTWNIQVISMHFILNFIIFGVLFALLIFLKPKLTKNKTGKNVFSISSIPKIIFYVLLNEYLILMAWMDFISGRYTVLWKKAESTR